MQGVGVISSLLKNVMRHFGLRQAELADAMGVSIDRVKSLTSGKAKNLRREEGEALIKKLHIRGDWLATGEGPMLQSDGEREMGRRLDLLKLATGKAQIEGLEPHYARLLMEVLFYAELGDADALRQALNPLRPDEMALMSSYRRCSEDAKVHLIQQAAVLSAGVAIGTPGSATTATAGDKIDVKATRNFLGVAVGKIAKK